MEILGKEHIDSQRNQEQSPAEQQEEPSTQGLEERESQLQRNTGEHMNVAENGDTRNPGDMSIDESSQDGEVTEQEDLEHAQDASPLVEALQGMHGSIGLSSPELITLFEVALQRREPSPKEEQSLIEGTKEDTAVAADQPEGPGDVVSKHLQDAPPSVGALQGMQSSNTVSLHELTKLPEVELQPREASPAEEQDLERSTQEDFTRAADQVEGPENGISKHVQDAPPLAGASTGTESSTEVSLPELIPSFEVKLLQQEASTGEGDSTEPVMLEDMVQSGQEDQTEATGQQEGLLAVEGAGQEQESEEEGSEQESNNEDDGEKSTTEGVPKHRRTYCRKTSCATCKVQCGHCRDCASNNSKTGCKERPQCPDKKPRDIRPGKVKETPKTLTPGGGTSTSKEAKSRSRTMLR